MDNYLEILFFCSMISIVNSSPMLQCVVGNRTYAVEEVFHPVVIANGREFEAVCYSCICSPATIPLCEEVTCPVLECSSPVRLNGECCPVCTEEGTAAASQCVYNGLLIQHGETFHPSSIRANGQSSLLNLTTNPCNECTCLNGVVSCKDVSTECPTLECDRNSAITPDGKCCPVCPSCTSPDGRKFSNGESWHPFFPSIGFITCINCTCENSQSVCTKVPCPDTPLPICSPDEPIEPVILCCPKCIRENTVSTSSHTTTTTSPTTATISDPTDISPGILPLNTTAPHSSSTPSPPAKGPKPKCTSSYTVKVWRHLTQDAMAIKHTVDQSDAIKISKWTLVNGRYTRMDEVVSAANFNSADYNFTGWTIPRRVNGLSSREKKRQKIANCSSNCAAMIVNMLRTVPQLLECK